MGSGRKLNQDLAWKGKAKDRQNIILMLEEKAKPYVYVTDIQSTLVSISIQFVLAKD